MAHRDRPARRKSLGRGPVGGAVLGFALKHAFVYNFPEEDQALRTALGEGGRPGADGPHHARPTVLGMSWSRTLSGLAAALTQIPPCPIVQLPGRWPPPDGRDLLDLVRSVAASRRPGARLYAPMNPG